MSSVSLCMIVKNEEDYIEGAIQSAARHVDDIVVVDTGSTDGTLDILARNGVVPHIFRWNGSFADARNAGLEAAKTDWVFVMDADEQLDSTTASGIQAVARSGYSYATLRIRNYVPDSGHIITGKEAQYLDVTNPAQERSNWYIDQQSMRVFRRGPRFVGRVHEIVDNDMSATVGTNILLHHYGKLNKDREVKKASQYFEMAVAEVNARPKEPMPWYNLMQQSAKIGDWKTAALAAAHCRNLGKHIGMDRNSHVMYMGALGLRILGHKELSYKWSYQAMQLNPRDILCAGIHAANCADRGMGDEAEHWFQASMATGNKFNAALYDKYRDRIKSSKEVENIVSSIQSMLDNNYRITK